MKNPVPACVQTTLFRSGDDGYECYRIPAVVVSRTGVILAFAEGRKDGRGDYADVNLMLKRSRDNGATWSEARVIVDDGDHTMGNPCPIYDARTSTVHLLFCRENRQVFAIRSTDDGEHWSVPTEISASVIDRRMYFAYTGPGHGVQLASGRLVAPSCADYGKRIGDVQGSYIIYSDDSGRSWKVGGLLEAEASDECEVVELADGKLYLFGRNSCGKRARAYSYSSDGGQSWTAVAYESRLPESASGCQGSIVRVSQSPTSDRNRIVVANAANIYGRTQLTLRMSYDETRSWPVQKILYEGSAAYSDLAVTQDGRILCLYEADDYTRIACALIDVGWLTD